MDVLKIKNYTIVGQKIVAWLFESTELVLYVEGGVKLYIPVSESEKSTIDDKLRAIVYKG